MFPTAAARSDHPCWVQVVQRPDRLARHLIAPSLPAHVLPCGAQVWGRLNPSGLLAPLVRIGDRTAPATKLAICEPLGALVTSHNGGSSACLVGGAVLTWLGCC